MIRQAAHAQLDAQVEQALAKPAEHFLEKHLRRPRALSAEQAERLLALRGREGAGPLAETRQGFGTGNDEIHRQTGTKDFHQVVKTAA